MTRTLYRLGPAALTIMVLHRHPLVLSSLLLVALSGFIAVRLRRALSKPIRDYGALDAAVALPLVRWVYRRWPARPVHEQRTVYVMESDPLFATYVQKAATRVAQTPVGDVAPF